MIDPHVHCRDGKQAYKGTIKSVFEIADEQGVKRIFDMPNTDPPILSERRVQRRLKLVPGSREGDYFLYVGATADERQLEGAVRCYEKYGEVVGVKLYAGESVGGLAVTGIEEQRKVYKTLTELGYTGVLAVHCEKEDYLRPEFWDPSEPITHSQARPKIAEIKSIKDQIKFAMETDFNGTLHICHVSCPESVELIAEARNEKMKITCGVTPHHILWDNNMLKETVGLFYKTNPPLRGKDDVAILRQHLREGRIDWIETDHAPHADNEKIYPHYLSGHPSLYLYGEFVSDFLPSIGISAEQVKNLTHGNIYMAFENKLG